MSQSQDRYQTPCKFCIFAKWDGDEQVDCEANQLTNYFAAYDEEKKFFVKNGVCLYYRPQTWNDGNIDVDKALKEIENITVPSVLIDLNNTNLELPDTPVKNIKIICHAGYNKTELEKRNILKKASEYNSKGWTNLKISFVNEEGYWQNLLFPLSNHYLIVLKNTSDLVNIENIYKNIKYTYVDDKNEIYGCMTFALKCHYQKDMDIIENIKFLDRKINEHNIT